MSLIHFDPATAQLFPENEIKFEHKLPGKNQSENSITCFLQDRQGFLWVGTKGGLFQYDGYDFTLFKMEPKNDSTLSHSNIRCLIEYSQDELLLIGTDKGGLNIYNKRTGKFSCFLHDENDPNSIGSNTVFDMLEDENGKIWIATIGGGLNEFDMDRKIFTKYVIDEKSPEQFRNNCMKCLYLDSTNGLLVGTRFSGVFHFDRDSKKFIPISDSGNKVVLENIWSMAKDHADNLWVGTEKNGIYRIRKEEQNNYEFENFGVAHGFFNRSVIKVFCDSKGSIWAGVWAGGLYKYDHTNNHFKRYKEDRENPLTIRGNHVLSIFEDNAGTLWIGTHARGINMIQSQKWKFYPHRFNEVHNYNLIENEVRSILCQDNFHILWLGTSQGLIKLNTQNGDYNHYHTMPDIEQGILHNAVNAICTGRHPNTLWIGTPIGLTQMDTRNNTFKHYRSSEMDSSGPLNINIHKILQDKNGFLWIGTSRIGLIRFDPVKKEFRKYGKNLKDTSIVMPWVIRTMLENGNGKLYLGTSNGINIFDKQSEQFEVFSKNDRLNTLLKTDITTIHRDSRNMLWIGTYDYGLIKYDELAGTFTYFTEKDGLGSNDICGIMEDRKGILYISTNNGITNFDSSNEEFRNFWVEDGLHGTEFRENAYAKTKGGKMFFGGISGFTSLVPDEMGTNEFIPPVYITNFEILHSEFHPIENISYTSVEMNHQLNSFSISFVALNYINSQKNQYLFQLEGYDRDWQEAGLFREITYKNVEPGKYTFRVIGSNNDSIWNKQGDTLFITIKPPFWKLLIFKIFIVILVTGIVTILIRRRFILIKRESDIRRRFSHALIKNQEFERKRIAAELHDSLGQDLLVIKNRTRLIMRKEKKDVSAFGELDQISNVADDAIKNIRHISYNLHPYHLEKIGLTDSLKAMIDKINEASNVVFEYEIENIDHTLPKDQEINCYRVLQELLNNIIKHSDAMTAWVKIIRLNKRIVIYVKDDGIGFDYGKVKSELRGFGLSGVKERIDILKGKLEIETEINKGTNVVIEIPI